MARVFRQMNKEFCNRAIRKRRKHIQRFTTKGQKVPSDLGIIGFVRRRSARLQHLLHQVEADARFALILGHSEVVEQVKMSHVGAVGVPVLVDQPFPLAGVSMSRTDVLGLQMLQLTVDVVSVRHPGRDEGSSNSEIGGREKSEFKNGARTETIRLRYKKNVLRTRFKLKQPQFTSAIS